MCDVRPSTSACRRPSNTSCGRPASACGRRPSRTASCCNQARPDCCKIPCCPPTLPKCPQGFYAERTQPIHPDRTYIPPSIPFDAFSSYREQFVQRCGPPAQSYKPKTTFDASDAKMEGMSSYREAFTPKPLMGYQKPPWSIAAQFTPSGAKMDGVSTYRNDYPALCHGDRAQSLKPLKTFDPSDAKMDGVSTYRGSFVPYCSREYDYAKQPQYKKQVVPSLSCAPMDGTSTYRGDFWPKCAAKRKSMKPTVAGKFSDAKFADRTTYRNDFNPFHFNKCVGECIPAEVYDEMYPDCGIMGCGPDPPSNSEAQQENCPLMPGCSGRATRQPGSCGNEMGLFPGQPLPECCQPDAATVNEGGDC